MNRIVQKYEGFVIKDEKGQYYCENSDTDWWFDESIRFVCIFETTKDAQNTIDGLVPLGFVGGITEVEFEVVEKVK